jgi:hypothetical protein
VYEYPGLQNYSPLGICGGSTSASYLDLFILASVTGKNIMLFRGGCLPETAESFDVELYRESDVLRKNNTLFIMYRPVGVEMQVSFSSLLPVTENDRVGVWPSQFIEM